MTLVKWKMAFAVYFGLLWLIAVLINIFSASHTWNRGYGRVWRLLPSSIELPFGIISLPLVLIFIIALQPFKDIVMKNLNYFALGLLLLTSCTVCTVVTIVLMQEHMIQNLDPELTSLLHQDYGHSSSNNDSALTFTQSMDYVQNKFKCCGVRGDSDYLKTKWYESGDMHGKSRNVPPSCCIPEGVEGNHVNISHSGSPISVTSRKFFNMLEEGWQRPQAKDQVSCQSPDVTVHRKARYKEGCLQFIETWLRLDSAMTLFSGIIICILQLGGASLSVMLKYKLRNNNQNQAENM